MTSQVPSRKPDEHDAKRKRSDGPITLRDVAEQAGVSVSTVSLVLNAKANARIGQKTREQVIATAEALGYRPNALAKSLVRGSSKIIGLVTDGIATTPFAGAIIRGAQEEAWRNGYVLLIADTSDLSDRATEAIEKMHDHQAAGILYSSWYHHAVQPPRSLQELPTVFVNCFAEGDERPAVLPDEVQGGRLATELLINQGHRHVVFINSSEDAPSATGRGAGFEEAVSAVKKTSLKSSIIYIDPGSDSAFAQAGFLAGMDILSSSDRPSAVFCYNDRTAMGIYSAAHELGLKIPEDLAVVGFDDQEVITESMRPKLSTVALPHYELGSRGVQILLKNINNPDSHSGVERIPCPAVERQSV